MCPELETETASNDQTKSSNESEPLLFVPTLLSKSFQSLGIAFVSKLLAYSESAIVEIPGLGDLKRAKALATRKLYQRLHELGTSLDDLIVHEIVPLEILPTPLLVGLTVRKFLNDFETSSLSGKARHEVTQL